MWTLFLLGHLSTILYLLGNYWQPALRGSHHLLYFLWISLLFALYMATVWLVRRGREESHPLLVPLIVGWAICFRISLLWIPPGFLSDDLYRYLWDGLVQRSGINPYQYPPEADELAFLRDDSIFPMINRKGALTIYPPGAQIFYWAMAGAWPGSVVGMKGAILAADLCSILLLLMLLRKLGIKRSNVLLYAWNPLVVVEVGLSGHLDGVMLPFLLLAILFALKGRAGLAGLFLGLAALIKLYPALLLPVLYRRRMWPLPATFAMSVALGYWYYHDVGSQIMGYLPNYLGPGEENNLGLRQILLHLFGAATDEPRRFVLAFTACILLLAMWQCLRKDGKAPREVIGWAVGTIALYLLLVSPSVYPWYLICLLALASLTQAWWTYPWFFWSWSINLDMLAYRPDLEAYASWLRLGEYAPLFLWLGTGWLWGHFQKGLDAYNYRRATS